MELQQLLVNKVTMKIKIRVVAKRKQSNYELDKDKIKMIIML